MRWWRPFLVLLALVFLAPMRTVWAAYAVTAAGYDDIQEILDDLGIDSDTIAETNLADLSILSQYAAVFINCSSTINGNTAAAVNALRAYVSNGGVIYASDWAYSVVEEAFPGYVEFYSFPKIGVSQLNIPATIAQSSMRDYIGANQINVNFNLSAWVPIKGVQSSQVTTYLQGAGGDATINGKPILVKFDYGNGSVIYTSFHNEGGLSGSAVRALEYMVLLSVLSTTANNLAAEMRNRGYIPVQENFHLVAPATTENFTFPFTGSTDTDLLFATAWRGSGHTLRLTVPSPVGGATGMAEAATSPLFVEADVNQTSTWAPTVTNVVGTDNTPFVLMVGRRIPAFADVQIKAYPNPFRATDHSVVVLEGLPEVATVKIFTVDGKLVKTLHKNDPSGTAFWDVNTDDGQKVSSGLYLISAEANGTVKQGKVVILR